MNEFSERKTPLFEPEKIQIDREKYERIAHDLYQENWQDIDGISNENNGDDGIDKALDEIDPEVLNKFWGHGVIRGDYQRQIAAVLSIIENNVISGDFGPLRGSPYLDAYTDANFLVVSNYRHNLINGNTTEERRRQQVRAVDQQGHSRIGIKIKPGVFACNKRLDVLVPHLRKLFPDATILRANELSDWIRE